jgi:hypothetical protein
MEFSQLGASKTARFRQLNRFQPELRVALGLLDVHMPWFSAFAAKKEEAEATDSKNLGHVGGRRIFPLAAEIIDPGNNYTS